MSMFQPANAYRFRIGDFVVTTLLDAQMVASFDLVQSIDPDQARRLHAESFRPTPPRITLNVYLLEIDDRKILVDTGLGGLADDAGPYLMRDLEQLGVGANDIDTILITHVHPDHVGGLIDADDRPIFNNAKVLVPAGELDYWGGEIPADISDTQKAQFQAAHRVLAAAGSQIQHLEGTDVVPGITRVPLPGHTPDHSGYRIASGHDRLLIWADIVHLPQIQFPRPEATVAFDTDPDQAAVTRRRIMAEVAESQELIAGHHLDFPGLGHIVDDDHGFRFVPQVWQPMI